MNHLPHDFLELSLSGPHAQDRDDTLLEYAVVVVLTMYYNASYLRLLHQHQQNQQLHNYTTSIGRPCRITFFHKAGESPVQLIVSCLQVGIVDGATARQCKIGMKNP